MEVKHFLSLSHALHLQHTLNVEKTVLIHVGTKTVFCAEGSSLAGCTHYGTGL